MKIRTPIMAALLVASLLAGSIVPVSAATRSAAITVAYGITLQFNEQEVLLTDAKGRKVEPFVYNGTTYVPIRAVSELFGAEVSYDNKTNTAYVYDDFSEACYLLYEMDNVVEYTQYYALDMLSAAANSTGTNWNAMDVFEKEYNHVVAVIERLNKMLNTAAEDNGIVSDLLDGTIGKSYNSFITEFKKFGDALSSFADNNSQAHYYLIDITQRSLSLTSKRVLTDIDDYLQANCLWRDLGQNDPLVE